MSHTKKNKALKHKLKKQQKNEDKLSKKIDSDKGIQEQKNDVATKLGEYKGDKLDTSTSTNKEPQSSIIIELPEDEGYVGSSELVDKQEPLPDKSEPLPESAASSIEAPQPKEKVTKTKDASNKYIQAFIVMAGIVLVIIGVYFMIQLFNDTKDSVVGVTSQEDTEVVSDWEELYNEVEQESLRQEISKENYESEELVDINE